MKTLRACMLTAVALGALMVGAPASACPRCSEPWLWGPACLAQYCQICGCNDRTATPVEPSLLASEPASTCAALDEAQAALPIADGDPSTSATVVTQE